MANELSQPGIVEVAAEIGSDDVAVPEAGHKEDGRNADHLWPVFVQERSRDAETGESSRREIPGGLQVHLARQVLATFCDGNPQTIKISRREQKLRAGRSAQAGMKVKPG